MKNTKWLVLAVVCFGFAVIFSGCGGIGAIQRSDQKVMERIPNVAQPDWVNSTKDYFEKDGNLYYRGMSEHDTDLELSVRSAQGRAKIGLNETIKTRMLTEFTKALEGAKLEKAGGYLKDAFVSSTTKVDISGSVQAESYSEKISELGQSGVESVYYRSYVLLQVPKLAYDQAVKMTFSDMKEQLKANAGAREAADAAEQRFYQNGNIK